MLIMGWITDKIAEMWWTICLSLDRGLYKIVAWVYDILIAIPEQNILSNDVIDTLTSRLFTVASVAMLFVVAYALLRGIINPDEVSGKGAYSGTKVVAGIIKALLAITLIPTAFDFAYSIQSSILQENIIGKIVLGTQNTVEPLDDKYDPGLAFSIDLYHTFLYDHESFSPHKVYTTDSGVEFTNSTDDAFALSKAIGQWYCPASDSWSNGYEVPCVNNSLTAGRINDSDYEYTPLIGFFAGVFVLVILVLYLFDIAIRTIKLVFLEIIAPIPSFLLIIPNQTKVFGSWFKETIKTYADLFIRLAILYFGVFVIQQIFVMENIHLIGNTSSFAVKLFLVFGVLMFINKAPKLVSTIFGIDTGYGFSLKKRWDDVKGGWDQVRSAAKAPANAFKSTVGAAGSKIGGAVGGIALANKAYKEGLNMGIKPKNKKDAFFRRAFMNINGLRNGYQGGLKNVGSAYNYELENQRAYANNPNGTVFSAIGDQLRDNFGFDSRYDYMVKRDEIQRDFEVTPLRNRIADNKRASSEALAKVERKYKQAIDDNKKAGELVSSVDDSIISDLNKSTSERKFKINQKMSAKKDLSEYIKDSRNSVKENVEVGNHKYGELSLNELEERYNSFKNRYSKGELKISADEFNKCSDDFKSHIDSLTKKVELDAKANKDTFDNSFDNSSEEMNWYELQSLKERVSREGILDANGNRNYSDDIFKQISDAEDALKLECYNELKTGVTKAGYKSLSEASKSKFIQLKNFIDIKDSFIGLDNTEATPEEIAAARKQISEMFDNTTNLDNDSIIKLKKLFNSTYEKASSSRNITLNNTVVDVNGISKTLAAINYENDRDEALATERDKQTEKFKESHVSEKNQRDSHKIRRDNQKKVHKAERKS